MNEQEVKAIEQALAEIDTTAIHLRRQITEAEEEIARLEAVKRLLVRLLPTDKRINQLFK